MTRSKKPNSGFTLVEIICVVVLLGLFGSIGVALMRDTANTGRSNVLDTNVIELNRAVASLQAAGTVFASGTLSITTGTQTTTANVTLPSPATPAACLAFISTLATTDGIKSLGITATLGKQVTASSYTYTLDSSNVPVWSVAAGTNLPP